MKHKWKMQQQDSDSDSYDERYDRASRYTTEQNHEYRMICRQYHIVSCQALQKDMENGTASEITKHKELDIEILKLQIQLEKITQKK